MKTCTKCKEEKSESEFYSGRADCKPCTSARTNAWRRAHPNVEYARRWNAKNPEAFQAAKANWRENARGARAAYNARWVQENLGTHNARSGRRRATALQATPTWANKDYIQGFYELAAAKTKWLGIEYHVDHQVPLKSALVCGLHNEFNLQVLHGLENRSKGNRYWPDMPEQGI